MFVCGTVDEDNANVNAMKTNPRDDASMSPSQTATLSTRKFRQKTPFIERIVQLGIDTQPTNNKKRNPHNNKTNRYHNISKLN